MKDRLESLAGWIGLVLLIGGYGSNLLGIVAEPAYIFWLVLGGVAIAAWGWYSAETDIEQPPGFAQGRPQHRRSAKQRRNACFRFWAAVLIFGLVCFLEGTSFFDLADMHERKELPDRYDGQNEIPFETRASFRDRGDLSHIVAFGKEKISFDIRKRPRLPWVQIEGISLVVEQYEPEPDHNPCYPMAFVAKPPNVFIAHIDKSIRDGQRLFPVKHVTFSEGAPRADSFLVENWISDPLLFIEDSKPESCVVKVNAETSGVYTYRLQVRLRHLWRTQVWHSSVRRCRFGGDCEGTPTGRESQRPPAPAPEGNDVPVFPARNPNPSE